MIIDWKDPSKELPADGTYIAVLKYHNKNCWPLSAEIIFGEVESYTRSDNIRVARVNTNDFTGAGSYCWNFHITPCHDSDYIVAWAFASEFKRPTFLNHDKHWGDEK